MKQIMKVINIKARYYHHSPSQHAALKVASTKTGMNKQWETEACNRVR